MISNGRRVHYTDVPEPGESSWLPALARLSSVGAGVATPLKSWTRRSSSTYPDRPRVNALRPEREAKSDITAIALSASLTTSHPTMPNIALSQKERRDVVAYILTLKDEASGGGP